MAALAVIGLLLATASGAAAHAAFATSQPEPGANLATAPGMVTLRFDEPLIPELSSVTVTDPTGREFTGGPTGEQEVRVDVDSTAQGEYRVEWRTVSPVDGHTLRGAFAFGVGATVGEQSAPSNEPTPTDLLVGASRTLEYVGLLGALGLLSLAALSASEGLAWAPRGLHRWLVVAAAGGALTVGGELLLAVGEALGSGARSFLTAPSGLPRLARLLTELAAATVTVRAAQRAGGGHVAQRPVRVAATLLTLLSLLLLSAAGHAAASGLYGILADAGHLWAAGVWAGALLVMGVHRPPGGWRQETGRRLVRAFTPIALTMFTVTVVLGSVRGAQELAQLSQLWTTRYGQVLTGKLVLVAAMVPLSVSAWRRRRPYARAEALLALGAVVAAGALASFPVPPARAAGEARPTEAVNETASLPREGDLTMAAAAGRTLVGLTVRPAEPGVNDLYVHLIPVTGVESAEPLTAGLTVDGRDLGAMRRCGHACRLATLPLDGGEGIGITVSGDDGGTATFALPELDPPDGSALAERLTTRMQQVERLRYDEVFGPSDPPITSTWELIAPDRLHGIIDGGTEYQEIVRIEGRMWRRSSPHGPWEARDREGPVVRVNRFIWDYEDKTAARIVATDTVDGIDTLVVTFFVDVGGMPIWYRLWVDDDDRVRRAQMRAQGHFMDHRYYDFGAPIEITPPQ